MVLNWFTKETKSLYVARPEEAADRLIYLHPDRSVPRGTKLTVRSDECALFFREGRYIGRIDAGTVLLDTANFPFLGHLFVDQFTDANHFICEIFFVSLSETIFSIPTAELGQYKDRNSANVASIIGGLSYTLKVTDPAKLILDLGGQSAGSGDVIKEILNGRMLNQFRRAVGMRTQAVPVLDVVSNIDAEAISEEVRRLGDAEFRTVGVGVNRVFDLALSLDEASLHLLREFGRQEAELALQAKGMKLATGDGFAEFNMIQAQRAALEGLGKGFSSGNGPMVMTGMNLGGNLTGMPPGRGAPRAPAGRAGSVLSGQAMFLIRTPSGELGPYSARQVALLAISKSVALSDLVIRGAADPDDVSFSADLEPQIASEYKRRAPSITSARASGDNDKAFDVAVTAAFADGVLTRAELDMLVGLSLALGLDADANAAQSRVFNLAKGRNLRIEL
jgi:membrane protease subunit (stomatin/prohibitin family)